MVQSFKIILIITCTCILLITSIPYIPINKEKRNCAKMMLFSSYASATLLKDGFIVMVTCQAAQKQKEVDFI